MGIESTMADPTSRILALERRLEALAALCGQSIPQLDAESQAITTALRQSKGG